MGLVFMLYALFGSVFTIGKSGLEYSQPLFLVGARMTIAGLLILGYLLIRGQMRFRFSKKDLFLLLKLAIFNIYLTNACEFLGLKYLSSFKTCFLYSLAPFLSALFSYFIFVERLSPKKWAGLLIGFLGFGPVLLMQGADEITTGSFWLFSWPELAVFGACAFSVYGWILLRQIVSRSEISPLTANGLSMLAGGLFCLANSYLVEEWNPVPVTEYLPFFECSIALIIISNFICYNLYGYLLKRYSATFMSLAGFSTPLFAAFFGWFFLKEEISWHFYLSAAVVFTGLLLFHQEELSLKPATASN